MRSAIYECEVVHERLKPKRHGFRYRLFYFDLDLEEIPSLAKRFRLFGYNRFNWYSFRDSDHLDLGKEDIRSNLQAWLAEQGVTLKKEHRVRLLTLPRILGYCFNPVCFYYVSDPGGTPLYVVVEVCNTFREVKPWLIQQTSDKSVFTRRVPKHFYVSPFSSVNTEFEFRVGLPGEQLEIHIDDLEEGKRTLVSWIRGERKAFSEGRLWWYTVRYPLLTLQVILKIHWQALRLWMKRLRVYRKDQDSELQTDLYHPHASIKNSPKSS